MVGGRYTIDARLLSRDHHQGRCAAIIAPLSKGPGNNCGM
jgi:hypothetical protein